jgi:Fur family transcriptional regulator, ferric uptake regulator
MAEESKELKKVGLKVTHPRVSVLRLLEDSKRKHMTADEIYRELVDQGEDIGLATVYRVLKQFEDAGLVIKHLFDDGSGTQHQACYELNEGSHHDHMVDISNGKVIEFVSNEIERLQEEIARKHGYEIVDHSLVMYVRPLNR